jgi:glycosyltransferase involved in cell wall biosynthesis
MRSRRAVVISFTKIAQEPRATRQARALKDAGWHVTLAGHESCNPIPEGCDFIALEPISSLPAPIRPLAFAALLGCSLSSRCAEIYYWLRSAHRSAAQRLSKIDASLVVCNDYYTLPAAERLARRCGARLVADCHEYALGEYPENRTWNLLFRPYVDAIQRLHLPRADAITAVSAGIALQIAADYNLASTPAVVRNAPIYEPTEFRPCGKHIELLYHGLIAPIRELHVLVEAMAATRPEFRLVIRGHGDADYRAQLEAQSLRLGLAERIRFEESVPFKQLISVAQASDVGVFLSRDLSPQMRFVLPNKLFEYLMAGLAVCVSDLAEMAAIVNAHKAGVLVPHVTPAVVADQINSLDRPTINALKQRALAAARKLNWENERAVFLRACGLEQTQCAA